MIEELPENADSIDISEAINRLLKGEPVQYIFEHALWMGLDLRVTPSTLIPRPETAEIISLSNKPNNPNLRVLDIGTGSGCIAIALKKKHPDWTVSACDISQEALTVAKENAKRNDADVNFFHCDILHEVPEWPFDLIISNPPYVCESEKNTM
ncbi:MAG: peptide chain release factor N(5)-glutamine methyltransferase, partial [Paludibacteraceae bacterium]|nr:peptide chain release factor N(5)-glutamine methyltransferase [Paludibacteraceae bacterium]